MCVFFGFLISCFFFLFFDFSNFFLNKLKYFLEHTKVLILFFVFFIFNFWCDHVEWTLHKGLVDFEICLGFELRRSRILRYDKSGSSAQWCNQHGQRLWRELDRSCEIRLQQCNRNSSQRWFGMSVPTYQGAVFVDPVNVQGWESHSGRTRWLTP